MMKLGDTIKHKGETFVLVEDSPGCGCSECCFRASTGGCDLEDVGVPEDVLYICHQGLDVFAHWEKQKDAVTVLTDYAQSEERAMAHMMTAVDNTENTDQMMSSLTIAELTRKLHKSVMRDIRNLITQEVITEHNFVPSTYLDRTGRTLPAYNLDFEATLVLVTGYDPKRRMAVIKEWNHLRQQPVTPSPADLSKIEILTMALESEQKAQELQTERDHAIATKMHISTKKAATAMGRLGGTTKALNAARRENEELKKKLEEGTTHLTTIAIPWFGRYFFPTTTAHQQLGKELTKLSEEMGLSIRKVPHQEYGEINAYSLEAIDLMKHRLDLFPRLLEKFRK